MFGLSVEHLTILAVAALFILGPERLPSAAAWLGKALRQVSDCTASTQEQLRSELGPEFDELRHPLRDPRRMNPREIATRSLLDENSARGEYTTTHLPAEAKRDKAPRPVAHAQDEHSPFDPEAT